MANTIKRIIEAPFQFVGWLFKDTYGRVLSVLLLTIAICMVNYPVQDTEVGVWEVEDTLTPAFSRETGGQSDTDSSGRVDRNAVASRKTIGRVSLTNRLALITMPFHHVSESQVKLISDGWNEARKNKVRRRQILRISRGLTLGLDLRGGT